MTVFISVNRRIVHNNAKNKETNPVWEIRTSKDQIDPQRVSSITYNNATVRLVYDPTHPLFSGAECWLEVDE